MSVSKKVVSFGEVLWDLLPTGKLPGGAPMNVAYHLQRLGMSANMISRVGEDELGQQLIDLLKEKQIDVSHIQIDNEQSTGVVEVTLDDGGSPSYEIVQPAAWDFIHLANTKEIVRKADALVYGSLATRNKVSSQTLFELLPLAPFRIFDVNLRPPFYTPEKLASLLQQADLVKMNEEELAIIGQYHQLQHFSEWDQLNHFQKRFQLQGIILTKGHEGALFFANGKVYQQPIFKVKVADTIGSGDAFLAGFTYQYLQGRPIPYCLRFGAYMGAFVASQKGAMPTYDASIVKQFENTDENSLRLT